MGYKEAREIFKEKFEKIEQKRLTQLDEANNLKDKRITDEQKEQERLDQLQNILDKNKICSHVHMVLKKK